MHALTRSRCPSILGFRRSVDTAQTIIAVASPPGRSPRGIIRLSGSAAPAVISTACEPELAGRKAPDDGAAPARRIFRTRIPVGSHRLPALLLSYAAPHSYTGEHAAELLVPGNPILLDRLVDHITEAARRKDLDVRRAEPGEFTARAYLNNRLTLTQAEGVNATISARCDAELRAAALLRDDALGRLAVALADDLASALALLEAGIDFTDEEDVVAITADALRTRLQDIRSRIALYLDRAVGSEQLEAAPWVVLTGRPNAGKSTLFNALLGRRRAIVSTVAGTTRDVLIEPLHVRTGYGDAEVMLVDLAGADADDPTAMNRHMQHAAEQARQRADLLLHCVPVSEPAPARRAAHELIVRTMADLADPAAADERDDLAVSAAANENIDELRRRIADRLADRAVSLTADAVALRPRHERELRDAAAAVAEAIDLLPQGSGPQVDDPELVAAILRAALDHLGNLAGRITPDDVLGKIFAEFCIGK